MSGWYQIENNVVMGTMSFQKAYGLFMKVWRHLFEQSWASMQTVSRPPVICWATRARSRETSATTTLVHTGREHRHRIPESR